MADGTYYLTRIDEKYIRYYAIKGDPHNGLGSHSPTLPLNGKAANRLSSMDAQFNSRNPFNI